MVVRRNRKVMVGRVGMEEVGRWVGGGRVVMVVGLGLDMVMGMATGMHMVVGGEEEGVGVILGKVVALLRGAEGEVARLGRNVV